MIFGKQKNYIHGRYVNSTSVDSYINTNPANGEQLCTVNLASRDDIELCIQSAEKGFKTWSKYSGVERARILAKAVTLLRVRNQELAELEVLDTGKPIQEANVVDVHSGADAIEYFAGLAPTLHGSHVELPHAFGYTRREPLGVCFGIGAWNYPIQIACWKAAVALACGNAMIFKPASPTPLTAFKLAEIFTEAGVPPGVFNVLVAGRKDLNILSTDPRIKKISLTGSTATGKRVMADAASTLKHITMELGGKSPLIVFPDADLENAVSAAMMANFYTQGEICTNGTRVFVHHDIHDAFVERLVERVKKLRIGDPMDASTQVGSLISKDHMETVLAFIESGKACGATLACGGYRYEVGACAKGSFVEPTVFIDCHDDMEIVREEIFGPVMSVLKFSDEDEVVDRANDSEYGLAAGVFTQDITRAHRVIANLQAGTCWINNYNITPIELPIGGYKQSGIGRENSPAAIEYYTQLKSVYVELGQVDCPYD